MGLFPAFNTPGNTSAFPLVNKPAFPSAVAQSATSGLWTASGQLAGANPGLSPSGSLPSASGQPTVMTRLSPQLPDAQSLVAQLGLQTRLLLDGTAQFNEPLLQSIVALREQALPALHLFLLSTSSVPAVLEGIQVAGRLYAAGVRGVEQLYPVLARWNSNPDPLIQTALARFYGRLNEPRAFGPLLSTLVNRAVNQYAMLGLPAYNVSEEAGAALLEQIARRSAQETVRQLLPFLSPGLTAAQSPVVPR